MALPKLRKPKAPTFKPYRPPGLTNVKPKLPTVGHYGPSIYNPSGRNQAYRTPAPIGGGPTRGAPQNPVNIPGTTKGTYDMGESREVMTPLTDYGSLISGDWEVQDAEAAMGAQMARARGDFQAQLRSQLIDLGLSDTSKLGNLGQYIDEDTIKAAVANKYSSTAQNAQGAEKARSQNNAALAARGILSSGQTTNAQQGVTAAQESANYSGLRNFLEGGASGLSGLADMEYQMARGVAAARAAAAGRAAEFGPGGQGTGFDQYGLSTDYSATRDTSAAVKNMLGQLGNQGLNRMTPRRLTRNQFMAKKPQGIYGNYLRAYNRQYG